MNRWEKKQIPKKILYEDGWYDRYHNLNLYACICASCGLHLINFNDDNIESSESDEPKEMFHDCMVYHEYIGLNNFCNRCGQRLDWSQK